MRKPSLIVLKGLPYSGKTTAAYKLVEKGRKVRISWTEIADALRGADEHSRNRLAMDAALRLMRNAFRLGIDVVLDECNLYPPSFALFVSFATQSGASIEYKIIRASADVCKERCIANGGSSEDVAKIDLLAEKYADVLK